MSHLQLVVTNLRGAIVGPVNLTVAAGTCAAIAGPSGAGKSLLLRMIADLDQNEGEVRVGDRRRERMSAPDWRRHAIFVPAEAGWWTETVLDHIVPQSRTEAIALAARLGLVEADLTRPVRTLSTGERQRLALVRALVAKPKLLLLDEPTGALDPASIDRVETILSETLVAGAIILLVSHDPSQAERLNAARYTMSAGRLAPA